MRPYVRPSNRTTIRYATLGGLPIGLLSLPFAVKAQMTPNDTPKQPSKKADNGLWIPLLLVFVALLVVCIVVVAKALRRKPNDPKNDISTDNQPSGIAGTVANIQIHDNGSAPDNSQDQSNSPTSNNSQTANNENLPSPPTKPEKKNFLGGFFSKLFRKSDDEQDGKNSDQAVPTPPQSSPTNNIVITKIAANAILEDLKRLAQQNINTNNLTQINNDFNKMCVDIGKRDPFISKIVNRYYGTIQRMMSERSRGQEKTHPKQFTLQLDALIAELSNYIATARERDQVSTTTETSQSPSSDVPIIGVDPSNPDFTGSSQHEASGYTAQSRTSTYSTPIAPARSDIDPLISMLEEQKDGLFRDNSDLKHKIEDADKAKQGLQSQLDSLTQVAQIREQLEKRQEQLPRTLEIYARKLLELWDAIKKRDMKYLESSAGLDAIDTYVYAAPGAYGRLLQDADGKTFDVEDVQRIAALQKEVHLALEREAQIRLIYPKTREPFDLKLHDWNGESDTQITLDRSQHNKIYSLKKPGYQRGASVLRKAQVIRYLFDDRSSDRGRTTSSTPEPTDTAQLLYNNQRLSQELAGQQERVAELEERLRSLDAQLARSQSDNQRLTQENFEQKRQDTPPAPPIAPSGDSVSGMPPYHGVETTGNKPSSTERDTANNPPPALPSTQPSGNSASPGGVEDLLDINF